MRVITLVILVSLVVVPAAFGCSCTSGDGSCSATANCTGGCYAICGTSDCSSGCTGGGGRDPIPKSGKSPQTLTYSGKGLSAAGLQEMLSSELGVRLVFVSKKAGDEFTVDLDNVAAADLLKGLGKLGAVAVLEQDGPIEPRTSRFSLKAENIPAVTVAQLLGEIFGGAAVAKSADPQAPVSLDLQQVTLEDVRTVLPRLTGIRVVGERAPAN